MRAPGGFASQTRPITARQVRLVFTTADVPLRLLRLAQASIAGELGRLGPNCQPQATSVAERMALLFSLAATEEDASYA